jgi:hypothetical protein
VKIGCEDDTAPRSPLESATIRAHAPTHPFLLYSFLNDNPAHRRIVAQALGVVHVLISSETTKH